MKKNRIISVLLAVIISTLSFTAVMAEDEKSDDTYASAVKIMSALGFMKSMNTEDESAAVTKAMFAAAVVDLMGYAEYDFSSESPFNDVTPSHALYNEICLAAQYGIVHGDDAQNFDPDSLISYTNALVMLENAMGYYTDAMYNGGYPNGYLSTAISIGLGDGITVGSDDKLNVGICAKLLLNAGETEIIKTVSDGSQNSIEKGDTLFWERHRIKKDTGIVKANENTSLDSSSGAGKNGIIVGDVEGYMYFSNESIDYLGYNVEFYYREDDNQNVILYMQPRNTDVTVINGADVESFEDQKLTYGEGNKTKTETISKNASVIYNGVYTIDYFFEDGTSIFCPEYGDIKLIDNNSDGRAEVVSILAYENIVVSAVDKEECIVYDKYDSNKNLDYSSSLDFWIITDSEGNIISFEDLQKWDIVSVAKSMDGNVLRAVMNRNSFIGTVNAINEVDGKKVITTEKGEFFVSKSYSDMKAMPQVGTSVTFYLDYYGNIAAIETGSTSNSYGFLIRSYYEPGMERCIGKLVNSDGVIADLSFASKVKIDGDSFTGQQLMDKLGVTEDGTAGPETAGSVGKYKLVVYKTNGSGEITYLDTETRGENEDDHTLFKINDFNDTYLWFATSRLFGRGSDSVCMGTDTLLFKTPAEEYANDLRDYGRGSISELIYGVNYTVNAYSTNPDSVIPEAVHMPLKSEDATNMPRNATTCIIRDIYEGVNTDDEIVSIIKYYTGTTEAESYVAQDVDTSKYKIGDIIKITKNARGDISYINHVYSADLGGFTAENVYGTGADFGNEYQPYAAKLFVIDNDVIGITDTVDENTSFTDCTFQRITDNDTAVYIVKNGRDKREVKRISASDLATVKDYYHNGEETPIYLMTTYGVSKVLVIYDLDE